MTFEPARRRKGHRVCSGTRGQASPASRVSRSCEQGRPDPCASVRTHPRRGSDFPPVVRTAMCFALRRSHFRRATGVSGADHRRATGTCIADLAPGSRCPSLRWVRTWSQGSGLPAWMLRVRRLAGEACPRDTCTRSGGPTAVAQVRNVMGGDRSGPSLGYWLGRSRIAGSFGITWFRRAISRRAAPPAGPRRRSGGSAVPE